VPHYDSADSVGTSLDPARVDPDTRRRRRRLRLLNADLEKIGILNVLGRDWLSIDGETGDLMFGRVSAERYLVLQMQLDEIAAGGHRPAFVPPRRRQVEAYSAAPVRPPVIALPGRLGPHIGGRQ
jgi:hypothetical protein